MHTHIGAFTYWHEDNTMFRVFSFKTEKSINSPADICVLCLWLELASLKKKLKLSLLIVCFIYTLFIRLALHDN